MDCALTTLVRSFARCRVLLIGDLILDRYIYGDAERISPEAPVPILRAVERSERVGGSANVAACLRALGCSVACCGVVGRDSAGDALIRLLDDLGADSGGVIRSQSRPTTNKTRLVGLAQHRHRQQLLRLDDEWTSALDPDERATLTEYVQQAVGMVDVVCLEDYDKGVLDDQLVALAVAEARRHGKPVLVDPARLSDYSRYRGATLLTPNRGELFLVVGDDCDSLEEIAQRAETLRCDVEADAVVVTLDRDGAILTGPDGWQHIPTRPRSVYDNTGAGDAVLSMLAAAVAAGGDWEDAVRLANVAGGLEVEKFGCVPITCEEVLAELRLEQDRRSGKIRTVDDLLAELSIRRDRGETMVFTNGCFDILHAGHVDLLTRARAEGSMLVVAINTDASVRSLDKGAGRPVNNEQDRARVLGALEAVDYVVLFDEPTPEALIRQVRPDVLVKGADWADKGVVGGQFVEANGGRVVLVPLVEGRSTTGLIEKIAGGKA
ncbi:MAG: D-glycero-beta-D-manno-heptose 1-phosphate adenylyltransferase [bacterium]|nr:D-glycero-beta-D-manno-heptose 1-phosphate adenylyltransferase [bacterium]